jgi:low affinity Fe/Cu permease
MWGAINTKLERCSQKATEWTGTAWAFVLACLSIVTWGVTGPIFHFSDTWQLVINTSTTIITFLMVFLIQRTQNKDSLAIHVKLNELLATKKGASNLLINVEDMSEGEVKLLHKKFSDLVERVKKEQDASQPHSVREIVKEIKKDIQ